MSALGSIFWGAIGGLIVSLPTLLTARKLRRQASEALEDAKRIQKPLTTLKPAEDIINSQVQKRSSYVPQPPPPRSRTNYVRQESSAASHVVAAGIGAAAGYYAGSAFASDSDAGESSCNSWSGGDCDGGDSWGDCDGGDC